MNNENSHRWIWAPAIGHGVALITIGGIIGNVPSPDTALYALAPSLMCFFIGLLSGTISAYIEGEAQEKGLLIAEMRARVTSLGELRLRYLESRRLSRETGAEQTISALLLEKAEQEIIDTQVQILEHLKSRIDMDVEILKSWFKSSRIRAAISGISSGISLSFFLFGCLALFLPIYLGKLHLEPPQRASSEAEEFRTDESILSQSPANHEPILRRHHSTQ